jgi:hypothetical protein
MQGKGREPCFSGVFKSADEHAVRNTAYRPKNQPNGDSPGT